MSALSGRPGQRILALFLGVALAVGALEVGLRSGLGVHIGVGVRPRFVVPHGALGWGLAPGVSAVHRTHAFAVDVGINRDGFRGPEWPAPDEARPRVLILGDSQAFGWGVAYDESLAGHLARMLPQTDVLSAGVPGYGTDQQYLLLAELLPRVRPQHVVLVYSPNDAIEVLQARAYGAAKPRFTVDTAGELTLQPAASSAPIFLDRSALWWAIQRQVDHRAAMQQVRDAEEEWRLTRALINAMVEELDGVPLTVVSFEGALQSLASQSEGLSHVHLDQVLPSLGSVAFLKGDPHWSSIGNQTVAHALAQRLGF